jgi:rare lipoprotein A
MTTRPRADTARRVALHALAAASIVALVLVGCAQQPAMQEPAAPPSAAPSSAAPPPVAPPAASPTASPAASAQPAREPDAPAMRGRISHYGEAFAGKPTASGEPFDPEKLTMAHRTLPFGTRVRVTNLENQRSVEVVVNDRGPAIAGRIADLSLGAARRLGMVADGVIDGVLEIVQLGKRP